MDRRQRERLHQHYRELKRDALLVQGRAHLEGDVAARTRRSLALARLAVWTLVLGAAVGVAGIALYLLFAAKQAGEEFAELRNQTIIDLLELDEDSDPE